MNTRVDHPNPNKRKSPPEQKESQAKILKTLDSSTQDEHKNSAESKKPAESFEQTSKPKLTDILILSTEACIKSKVDCSRMIYQGQFNGKSYILKVDPYDIDEKISQNQDSEIVTLFFQRLLSPYHDKHPKAYHAKVKLHDHSFKEAYAAAVDVIPHFTTLDDIPSKKINELNINGKLQGFGVATANAKIFNISDLHFGNVSIIDAENLESDDKESRSTLVIHDGDLSLLMLELPKTLRDFKLKIRVKDYSPDKWLDYEASDDEMSDEEESDDKAEDKNQFKLTQAMADEHDIVFFHFLILPPSLLKRLLHILCRNDDPDNIDYKYKQLLLNHEAYWNIVWKDENFTKLMSNNPHAVNKFIEYFKSLGQELDISKDDMIRTEEAIRKQEARLRDQQPYSANVDALDTTISLSSSSTTGLDLPMALPSSQSAMSLFHHTPITADLSAGHSLGLSLSAT